MEKLLDLSNIRGIIDSTLGLVVIYQTYNSKPTEPTKLQINKPEPPYITTLFEEKVEEFNLPQAEVDHYKAQLKRQYDSETISVYEMNIIDNMDGFEFEEYIAILLKNLGYSQAFVPQKSGDFGADIIATEKGNLRVAVQCKRYGTQNFVGNDAVQQVYSAMRYYDCNKALVFTNAYFSKPAFQMAQKLGVVLWNRKNLKEKIASVRKESWNDLSIKVLHKTNQ